MYACVRAPPHNESDLERVSKSYEKILSRHIYSVQKNPTITSTG